MIPVFTAAGSHPDCRAVLILIVALYRRPHDEFGDVLQVRDLLPNLVDLARKLALRNDLGGWKFSAGRQPRRSGLEALTRQGRDLFQTPEILKNDPENFLPYTSYA
jgi:hypothetical protein